MKNWIVRSITGIVYVAFIVLGLLYGTQFPILYALMALTLAIPAVMEFKRITMGGARESSVNTLYDIAVATLLIITCSPLVGDIYHKIALLLLTLLVVLMRLIAEIYSHDEQPIKSLTSSLASIVYIAMPMALLSVLYGSAGQYFTLLTFVLIWLNDTGAFVVGSLFGRHRLFPRVSPKKSWEGFFGGMLFSIAGAVGAYALFPTYLTTGSYSFFAVMGVVVSVFATWGDLVESAIKRAAGVKDSGQLLPGHGGMLDRIDSLLLVAPATLILYTIYHLFH